MFSRSHADGRRGMLNNHLLPYFRKFKLEDIRVVDIERFMTQMSKNGYSPSTINSAFYTSSSILKEAYRQELISKNPIDRVEPMAERTKRPDVIPLDIVIKLFAPENKMEYWKDSDFHYLFNLIAFSTGMRQAEILALRKKDINISWAWERYSRWISSSGRDWW